MSQSSFTLDQLQLSAHKQREMERKRRPQDDRIFATLLDDIRTRQERLARGERINTTHTSEDARPYTTAHGPAKHQREEALRIRNPKTVSSVQPIEWVTKAIQRWNSERQEMEPLGIIEFLRGSTLIGIRPLVDHFYPPPRRHNFNFCHPILNTPIENNDEATTNPESWPVIAVSHVLQHTSPSRKRRVEGEKNHRDALEQSANPDVRPPKTAPHLGERGRHIDSQQVTDNSSAATQRTRLWNRSGDGRQGNSRRDEEVNTFMDSLDELKKGQLHEKRQIRDHLGLFEQAYRRSERVELEEAAMGPPDQTRAHPVRVPTTGPQSAVSNHINKSLQTRLQQSDNIRKDATDLTKPMVEASSCEPSNESLARDSPHAGTGAERDSKSEGHAHNDASNLLADEIPVDAQTQRMLRQRQTRTSIKDAKHGQTLRKQATARGAAGLTLDSAKHVHHLSVNDETSRFDAQESAVLQSESTVRSTTPSVDRNRAEPTIDSCPVLPGGINGESSSIGPPAEQDETGPASEACGCYLSTVVDQILQVYDAAVLSASSHETSEVLISLSLFEAAFRHYGMDHTVLGLNGVLLAFEEELSTIAGDSWDRVVRCSVSFLLGRLRAHSSESSLPAIQTMEAALNFVADVIGLSALQSIRLDLVERRRTMTFEALAGLNEKDGFRLSQTESEFLSGILQGVRNKSSTKIELWLTDAFEVLYFFLAAHLGSHNKAKHQLASTTREQRLEWVVRKIKTQEPNSWRRADCSMHIIRGDVAREIIKDRLDSFRNKAYLRSSLLKTDVFLQAVVGFASSKAELVFNSFASSLKDVSDDHSAAIIEFNSCLSRVLYDFRSGVSTAVDNSRIDIAAHVFNISGINKQRRSRHLAVLDISSSYSIHTHHQTQVLASNYRTYKRPRWNVPEVTSSTTPARYVFHGDASIALEYVYVRDKLDLLAVGSRWEDCIRFVEAEAARAFESFNGESTTKAHSVFRAVGVNVLHVDWLEGAPDFVSLSQVVAEHPKVKSISMGFAVSRNEDFPSARVTFRLHTDPVATSNSDLASSSSVVQVLNRFVCSEAEAAHLEFVRVGGLRFLTNLLPEYRSAMWASHPFGSYFQGQLLRQGVLVAYSRQEVLFFLRTMIRLISRSERTVTEASLHLLEELALVEDELLLKAVVRTLESLCKIEDPTLSSGEAEGVVSLSGASPTSIQTAFLGCDGVRVLIKIIDSLPSANPLRWCLEEALTELLLLAPLCAQDGLIVHSKDWTAHFIANQAYARAMCMPYVVPSLLSRIHESFFEQRFEPRDFVRCTCGCSQVVPGTHTSVSAVVKLYCATIETQQGTEWVYHHPKLLVRLIQFMQSTNSSPSSTEVQRQVCSTLRKVLSLQSCSLEVSLLCFAAMTGDTGIVGAVNATSAADVRIELLQIFGLLLSRLISDRVWEVSAIQFLQSLVQFVTAVVAEESSAYQISTQIVATTLLRDGSASSSLSSSSSSLALLLYEEHGRTSTMRGSRSILQSMAKLVEESSTHQDLSGPTWMLPILIAVCAIVREEKVACVLGELDLERTLCSILLDEERPSMEAIVATRALSIFYYHVQSWPAWSSLLQPLQRELLNALAKSLHRGAKVSVPQKQLAVHAASMGEPLFGAEVLDVNMTLARFKNHLDRIGEDERRGEASRDHLSSEEHESNGEASVSRLLDELKLLLVLACVPQMCSAPAVHEEVRMIFGCLTKFIRDRSYVPEQQVLLYIGALANVTASLGAEISSFRVEKCLDSQLVGRIFVYMQRPNALLSSVASRALWALAAAFRERDVVFKCIRSTKNLVDEEQTGHRVSTPPDSASGIQLLVASVNATLTERKVYGILAAMKTVAWDVATLSMVLQYDDQGATQFFNQYRYATITNWILQLKTFAGVARSTNRETLSRTALVCGKLNFPGSGYDRELAELCSLAQSCLCAIGMVSATRTQPSAANVDRNLEDEIPRTKSAILPLLEDHYPLIVYRAVLCITVHVKFQPQFGHRLIGSSTLDRLLGLSFEHESELVRAASLKAIRKLLADPRCRGEPYHLLEKLLKRKDALARSLSTPDFDVLKETINVMVFLVSKMDDQNRRSELASMFRDPDKQIALARAFEVLCSRYRSEPNASTVLQGLVRFVIQLELTRLIDSDIMVDALTTAIHVYRKQDFLRPLVCRCLWEISTEANGVRCFATKARVDAILSLLHESLTNGEVRHIAMLLRTLATQNHSIQAYLNSSDSSCIAMIAKYISSFTNVSVGDVSVRHRVSYDLGVDEFGDGYGIIEGIKRRDSVIEDDEWQGIRITIDSQVTLSLFTDEVYEELLRLVLTLLESVSAAEERFGCACDGEKGCPACDPCDLFARAGGPGSIASFLFASRVAFHVGDTNRMLIEATGSEAYTIVRLALQALQILSLHHQSRVDILHGLNSRARWWSVTWLMERSKPDRVHQGGVVAELASSALLTLAHMAAEADVINFIMARREFILAVFFHLAVTEDDRHVKQCQRVAMFLIARMAEHPRVRRDLLFQEKTARLLASLHSIQDSLLLANALVLARNLRLCLPDDDLLRAATTAVNATADDARDSHAVISIGCEVLAHLLIAPRKSQTQANRSVLLAMSDNKARSGDRVSLPFRLAQLPVWRSLLSVFDCDTSQSTERLLEDETNAVLTVWKHEAATSSHKIVDFVEFLIDYHTPSSVDDSSPSPSIELTGWTKNLQASTASRHSLYLHSVELSCEQTKSERSDRSFAGSAKLWNFIRLLWRHRQGQQEYEQSGVVARIVEIFSRWSSSGQDASISVSSIARRQQLVSFVNEIAADSPSVCKALQMKGLIQTLEAFGTLNGEVGDCYALLAAAFKADTSQHGILLAHLRQELRFKIGQSADIQAPVSPSVCLFWMPVHPRYTIRWVSTSRVLQRDSIHPALRMMDATLDDGAGVQGALQLADAAATLDQRVLHGFLRCHGIGMLLDILRMSPSRRTTPVRAWGPMLAACMRLLTKCLQLEPNALRHFVADPRLVHAVKYNLFAVKREVQSAALELLDGLTRHSAAIAQMILHAEGWTTTPISVKSWMVSAIQHQARRLQLAHVRDKQAVDAVRPSRKQFVQLAHVTRLPIFARMSTIELARLGMALTETRLVEDDSFLVLLRDPHFSVPPTWMCPPASSAPVEAHRERFAQDITRRKASGAPLLMNTLQKNSFLDSCSAGTRATVSREISQQCERSAAQQRHPTSLLTRLHRFLVEDRAEILRRVTFKKHISHEDALSRLPARWNDTMSLLAVSSLFQGVSRDSLACLAVALGQPVSVSLPDVAVDNRVGALIVLVHSSAVEVQTRFPAEPSSSSQRLARGDVFVFPIRSNGLQIEAAVSSSRFQACVISEGLLRCELEPSEFDRVRERCKPTSDTAESMKLWMASRSRRRSGDQDQHYSRLRYIQTLALSTMLRLVQQHDAYAVSLATNPAIVGTLLELSHSDLDESIVNGAVRVVVALLLKDETGCSFASCDHWSVQGIGQGDRDIGVALAMLQCAILSQRSLVTAMGAIQVTVGKVKSTISEPVLARLAALFDTVLQDVESSHHTWIVTEVVTCCAALLRKTSHTSSALDDIVLRVFDKLSVASARISVEPLVQLVNHLLLDIKLEERSQPRRLYLRWTWLSSVIQSVAADVAVAALGVDSPNLVSMLSFLDSIGRHMITTTTSADETEFDYQEQRITWAKPLSEACCVLLHSFNRLDVPRPDVYHAIASLLIAIPSCARLASRVLVVSDSSVRTRFHQFIDAAFQAIPVSRIFSITGAEQEVVALLRCIHGLVQGSIKAAGYFAQSGFIELSFRYLDVRSSPPNGVTDTHATVLCHILLALKALVASDGPQSPLCLLRRHGPQLRRFQQRLGSIASLITTVAAIQLFTLVAHQSFASGDDLGDMAWLVSELAAYCLGCIQPDVELKQTDSSATREWLVQRYVASLEFVATLCESKPLQSLLFESQELSSAVSRLGACLLTDEWVSQPAIVSAIVQFGCLLTQAIVSERSTKATALVLILLDDWMPSVQQLWVSQLPTPGTPLSKMSSRLIGDAQRLEWNLCHLGHVNKRSLGSYRWVTASLAGLSTLLARHDVPKATTVYSMGLLSSIIRAVVYNGDSHQEQYSVAVESVVKMCATKGDDLLQLLDDPGMAHWSKLTWAAISVRGWNSDDPRHLKIAPLFLLVVIARRLWSRPKAASTWLLHDGNLRLMTSVVLPVVLRLVVSSRLITAFAKSVYKKCYAMIRFVVSAIVEYPSLRDTVGKQWRRQARAALSIEIVEFHLSGPHDLSQEVIKCLTAIVLNSVVDARGIMCSADAPRLIDKLTDLVTSGGNVQTTIDALDFFSTAAAGCPRAAVRVATPETRILQLAESILRLAIPSGQDSLRQLLALYRCCHVLVRYAPAHDIPRWCALPRQLLSQVASATEQSDLERACIATALRLQARLTLPPNCSYLWAPLMLAMSYVADAQTRLELLQLSSQVLCNGQAWMALEADSQLVQTTTTTLMSCLVDDGAVGGALCVAWIRAEPCDKLLLVQAIVKRLSSLRSLPPDHQLAITSLLPAVVTKLAQFNSLHWINEQSWVSLREAALSWSSASADRASVQTAQVAVVDGLLRARQLRVLHSDSAALRIMADSWAPLHRDLPSSFSADALAVARQLKRTLGITVDSNAPLLTSARCASAVSSLRNDTSHRSRYNYDLPLVAPPVSSRVASASGQQTHHVTNVRSQCKLLCRILAASFAGIGVAAFQVNSAIQSLLAFSQSPASAVVYHSLSHQLVDMVDGFSWELSAFTPTDQDGVPAKFASQCELLLALAASDGAFLQRLRSRRFVDEWVMIVAYASHHSNSLLLRSAPLLRLCVMIVRHQVGLAQPQSSPSSWRFLVVICVNYLILDRSPASSHALELLTDLLQLDAAFTTELWHVCSLTTTSTPAQGHILRVLTNPLCSEVAEDRRRGALLTYSLATSPQRALPLIRARDEGSVPLHEMLTRAMRLSLSNGKTRRTARTRPPDWSSPSSIFPLPIAFPASDTTLWLLRLLRVCLRDKPFAAVIATEIELVSQVFAAIACPSVPIAYAATIVLRDVWILNLRQTRSDVQIERSYRDLEFFVELSAHNGVVTLLPVATPHPLPTCFTLLELWLLYYVNQRVLETATVEATRHLEAVLEVLLAMISLCFSQIFATDDTVVEPHDRTRGQEHWKVASNGAQDRHTALCGTLMQLACADHLPKTPALRRVRLLALVLVKALCGGAGSAAYSVDWFLDLAQIDRLFAMIETSDNDEERACALALLRELAGASPIKLLIGLPSSPLLGLLVEWMSRRKLQEAAVAILRAVVTKTAISSAQANRLTRRRAQEQHENMLLNVARELAKSIETAPLRPSPRQSLPVHSAEISVQCSSINASAVPPQTVVLLQLKTLDETKQILREFRFRGKLTTENTSLCYEMVLETDAAWLACDVVIHHSLSTTAAIEHVVLPLVRESAGGTPPLKTLTIAPGSDILISSSHRLEVDDTEDSGALHRLLISQDASTTATSDAIAIVAELGKNHAVFCDAGVGLPRLILSAMDASSRLSPQLDMSALNALASWFWSHNNSLAHFRSAVSALTKLLQRMRTAQFLRSPPSVSVAVTTATTSAPTFLTSFTEWIATIESDSLTENCINALFFENGDIVRLLCQYAHPAESSGATFFRLIAAVVRVNRLHCEIFARVHAVRMMRALIDEGAPDIEQLRYAARAIAKITRVSTVADKFTRHGGFALFGRVAYELFCGSHDESTTKEAAASDLVLAASFIVEPFVQSIQLPDRTREQRKQLRLLATRPADAHTLSLVETLVLFLAWPLATSYARLAAVVLRMLIEKWPSRIGIETLVLTSVDAAATPAHQTQFSEGLRRCIALTQWDFCSEMHVVRHTYAAEVATGVRTGVLPLKVRNVFLPFDGDPFGSLFSSSSSLPVERQLTQRLRQVLAFVVDHATLVQTLSENRKRTLTSRLRTADTSARVAVGIHCVLVVVQDAVVDALSSLPSSTPPQSAQEAADTVQRWLVVVEQLCGLLCCAFHELDPAYYGQVFAQLHALVATELPVFLTKMERMQRRHDTVATVLTNLERLLVRLTSEHELRGVTSTGTSVAQDAKMYLTQYAQFKPVVAQALALALGCPNSLDRVQRAIVAAEYVWARVFVGSGGAASSLASFMAGTQESESLWVKLRGYADGLWLVLRHPLPLLRARWRAVASLISTLLSPADRGGVQFHAAVEAAVPKEDGGQQQPQDNDEGRRHEQWLLVQLGLASPRELQVSSPPIASLESLLDHCGCASMGIKKQLSLLNHSELRPHVLRVLADGLQLDSDAVEAMGTIELERSLRHLYAEALSASSDADAASFPQLVRVRIMLHALRDLVDQADLGLHLRVVVQRPVELSLWRLLVAPVLRARLYTAYYAAQNFVDSDAARRKELLRQQSSLAEADADKRRRTVTLHRQESSNSSARSKTASFGEAIVARRSEMAAAVHGWTRRRIAVVTNATATDPLLAAVSSGRELLTPRVMEILDGVDAADPLSDEKTITTIKHALDSRAAQPSSSSTSYRWLPIPQLSSRRYAVTAGGVVTRRLALLLLLLAFWRQEELASDLNNAVYARAFRSPLEKEEYFVRLHLRKALGELVRVWMPESGTLGLSLWHWRSYGVLGTALCLALAWLSPYVAGDASTRNAFMVGVTYALVLAVFALSALSMYSITQKHFILQRRRRLRLQPVGRYYQNALALVALGVEVVQLNAITFAPTFDWNSTDQIPAAIQYLGSLGIADIGVDQVELKAALCLAALSLWWLLLKCANKFQESSPFLNRVVTKDLPSVLHGVLYMGLISAFFSFLACADCADAAYATTLAKCAGARPAPFLLSHQGVACWTRAHAPLAALGLWGVLFFLPIGMLAQGMSQVLFQQEALDVKYAPVVLLGGQLIKALTATARAFFPFNVRLLAALALAGNATLLILMAKTEGASLWPLRVVKSGVYAASGWSAAVAIYRLEAPASSAVANNLVYMGWLAIAAATASAVRLRSWRLRDEDTPSSLVLVGGGGGDGGGDGLSLSLRRFMAAAAAGVAGARGEALVKEAARLRADAAPAELRPLMQRARAFARGTPASLSVAEAVFLQNARKQSKRLEQLRRRR